MANAKDDKDTEEPVYIVVEDFTDTYGRAWKKGEEFIVMADDAVTQAALDAEQIEESTEAEIAKVKMEKAKAEAAEKAKAVKAEADRVMAEAKEKADALENQFKTDEDKPRRGRPPGSGKTTPTPTQEPEKDKQAPIHATSHTTSHTTGPATSPGQTK